MTLLKSKIKNLKEQKGALSRQIGEYKKLGKSYDLILVEMKDISAQLKEHNALLSIENKNTHEEIDKDISQSLPRRFNVTLNQQNAPPVIIECLEKTNINADQWNAFVNNHPVACIYHRHEFQAVIENSFGHKTYYLLARDDAGDIQGVLPAIHTQSKLFGNYITTLPFFNYGGPLSHHPAIDEQLIQHLSKIAADLGVKHIEIREIQPRENYPARTDKMSLFLALPTLSEQLWKNLGTKLRAQVKKGQANHLHFKTGGIELVNDFYRVFSTNMRDLGTPVYSKQFFINLLSQSTLNSTIAIVYHQDKAVSCGFLLGFNDTLEIPWASTLRKANSLNANMVLYWNILSFAIEQGYAFFDFGRSSKGASTYKFKQQWGAVPAPLYWHYWLADGGKPPKLNPHNPKYQLVIKVWQQLPVWVTKIVGPFLVKNLP